MDLSEYGNVRLFAKSSKEAVEMPYKFVVVDLEDAIEKDALQGPFAPSAGYLLADIDFLMLRDRTFYQRFVPHVYPFPPTVSVTMKLDKIVTTPTPKLGKTLFDTMFQELCKNPKYDSAKFKTLPNGTTQISFYEHMTGEASVDELLSDSTVAFDIETGHSGNSNIWELNLKGSYDFFFAPIDTADQLGTALNFIGWKNKHMLLTNRHYRKNEKYTVVQFDHQEDKMHRLMPILNDIFSCDFSDSFGSKLAAASFVPREKNCMLQLHFVGNQLNISSVMKWVKSLETCGIGYVHETIFKEGVYGFLLRNRLLRVVHPLDHEQRKDSLNYGVTSKDDFDLVLKRMKPGVALRFGHFACSESHRGVAAIETTSSKAFEAFKLAAETLIFDNVGKMTKLIESVVLEYSDDEKAVIRVVFLFDILESIGEETLLKQIEAIEFGPFKKTLAPEGPQAIAAFASIDGLCAYPLGKNFWKSVSEGKFFSPEDIFSDPENNGVQLLLISPGQVSRGIADIRIVATDEIDYADLMEVMDLVNEESLILVKFSPSAGKLFIQVGRWENDSFPEYKRIDLKLCLDDQIRSMEQYKCLKPWAKSARFPEDLPEILDNSFAVQFLEGSQHLVQNFVIDIIESEIIKDVLSFELESTGPLVRVRFSDNKHIKTLRKKIKSKGMSYQTIAKNHLALIGDLPMFATFPNTNVVTSQIHNVNDFMQIKAKAVKKVPYINFTIERRTTDPLLKAEKEIYKARFPLKRYNIVLSSFIRALTDKSFPALSLPFARLEVIVYNKHFKLKVHVMEYFAGTLGAEAYGKLLVECAAHLEKYPGNKGKIGNPALHTVKKPVVVAKNPKIEAVKTQEDKAELKVEAPDAIPAIKQEAPAAKIVAHRLTELFGEESVQEPDVQLSPEEEMDWSCYYELIKDEAEFVTENPESRYVNIVKMYSLNFRPDLGDGYRFLFDKDGPVAVAKTWNGFAVVMKLAMSTLHAALLENNLEEPCIIEVQPSLLNGPHITYTQCFQISPDQSMHKLLNSFESLAFNLLHDSISSSVLRIGVSQAETEGLYHIFADIILPSELTPEHTASMAEFDFIWQHIVMRGSQ